jgi:hypothetical protein
LKKQ